MIALVIEINLTGQFFDFASCTSAHGNTSCGSSILIMHRFTGAPRSGSNWQKF
jgi:hypothetical protein